MHDAIRMMESKMKEESVVRSRMIAEQEILTIRLSKLREKLTDMPTELDEAIQKKLFMIEKKKDIRISTLIEYLDSLGLGLEIKTYSKNNYDGVKEETLLRI